MRTLYVKILAWFWAANVLVAGAGLLALLLWPDERPDDAAQWRTVASAMLTDFGRVGLSLLENEGRPALVRHRLQWEDRNDSRIGIYALDGRELSGPRATPVVTELFSRIERDGDVATMRLGPITYVATTVSDSDGLPVVVMREIGPRPPLGGPPGLRPPPRRAIAADAADAPDDDVATEASTEPPEGMPPPGFDDAPTGALAGLRRLARPSRLLLILAAVLCVSGVVCAALAHHLTRPMRDLRAAARRLAGGDLAARPGPRALRRRDEIGGLGRDFDEMADRIESLLGAQRRLVRDVSHELRSPLTRLGIALDLARRQAGDAAGPALDRIERESVRLNELIERLLTLARLESTEREPPREMLDLVALARDVVRDADFEARRDGRSVALAGAPPSAPVAVDAGLLRSALENVVRNAIRFTPTGGVVEVSVTLDDDHARVVVRDRGPGIAPDLLPHVFTPFFRDRDAPENTAANGAGLGLAIAERAVRVHGGTIVAENAADGGLLVAIALPRAAPDAG